MVFENIQIMDIWTREKVLQVIDLYRENVLLWNPQHSDYKDRTKRKDALKRISETLEIDQSDVDKKIKTLLSQYRREAKKVSSQNGDCGTSKWFAYNSMTFLVDRFKYTQNMDNSEVLKRKLVNKRKIIAFYTLFSD